MSNASSKLVESCKEMSCPGAAYDEDWPEADSEMRSLCCHSGPEGNMQYSNLGPL